ncbi:zf-TFIIB domain-containing protein [Roseateles sp.]|uniref:zf-TFIIB domain-containing protein n=1 Tax=Roseateles sp. TaxID=1971397 RepID=UPI0031DB55BE
MSLPRPATERRPGDEFPDTVPDFACGAAPALPPLAWVGEAPRRDGALIACPQCRAPMRHVVLAGHLAPATVDIDHCGPCGLVWFDARESVHLSPLAWVQLLRDLNRLRRPDRPHQPDRACPVCAQALKEVHNQTRYGRFPALECGGCGGHLHSQAGMLAERGLLRPLLPAERGALQAERRELLCLSCGAPADGKSECCAWCKSPLLMADMPRLASALRKRAASEPLLMPNGGKPVGWSCRGCGAPMDPTRETRCSTCQHAVVAPSFDELDGLLDAIENDWHLQDELSSRERRERAAAYGELAPRDAAGGKHGILWKGEYERRYDAENARREGRDWPVSGWPEGREGLPPTLMEIALRLAALLIR